MIPSGALTEWTKRVGWRVPGQVERDLVLSRLIVEISQDPYLSEELVFRGGTCLYKLHTPRAPRFSEDLDYVRTTAGGIGPLTEALNAVGERVGMPVRTKLTRHPKIFFRGELDSTNAPFKVKVEVNTFERCPARPAVFMPFSVDSSWFNDSAKVKTFALPELVATKLRALYQRRKGRDLFDLWYTMTVLGVDPTEIIACFGPYRPTDYTGRLAAENLRLKVKDKQFIDDLTPLVERWPDGYEIEAASELVIDRLLDRMD